MSNSDIDHNTRPTPQVTARVQEAAGWAPWPGSEIVHLESIVDDQGLMHRWAWLVPALAPIGGNEGPATVELWLRWQASHPGRGRACLIPIPGGTRQ